MRLELARACEVLARVRRDVSSQRRAERLWQDMRAAPEVADAGATRVHRLTGVHKCAHDPDAAAPPNDGGGLYLRRRGG
jgi:hypothetical protein